MKLPIITYVFLFVEFVAGSLLTGRIVNGWNTLPGEYPYVVSYRYRNEHNCAGSIIDKKWILTAAHCIYENFTNVSSILFGSTTIQEGTHPVENTRNIKRAIRHPLYQEYGGYENDVGLLELEEPLIFNRFIQPITLPNALSTTPPGSKARLVGWGYPETDGAIMDKLQAVDILVFSAEICRKTLGENFNPKVHICAGVPEGGKGQCSGDSGGPLTVGGVQIGIVSWSFKPCASKGYPGVFVRVSTYRQWITEIAGI